MYVNNQKACSHIGGYLPFEADITAFLQVGENSLIVCVTDVSDTSYHSRGKQTLKRGGMFYTAQSGIWQTVWMEWVPETYIQKLYLTTDYDKHEINIKVIANDSAPIHAQIYAGEQCIWQTDSFAQTSNNLLRAPITELHPWTPETPYLYTLRIRYGYDYVESYFALRTFTIEADEQGIPAFA